MAETLAALTTIVAALSGLVSLFTLFGKLFSMLHWGCSIYDVIDTLYEAGKNPELRSVLESVEGGEAFLMEMDKCEGDAKKLAKQADMEREKIMKLAYTCKIIWKERKKRALLEKQRERHGR